MGLRRFDHFDQASTANALDWHQDLFQLLFGRCLLSALLYTQTSGLPRSGRWRCVPLTCRTCGEIFRASAMRGTKAALLLLLLRSREAWTTLSLYTYALPKEFTEDVAAMPLDRYKEPWTSWYDTDQGLHPYLKSLSDPDPQEGTLFYIPVYTAQYYHSLLVEEKLSHAYCSFMTGQLVARVLEWVKTSFPYWNRTNGMDHFIVAPLDHGRCSSLAGLSRDEYGDLFAIQPSGDIFAKDGGDHDWPCYQPARDIVIPILTESNFASQDIVRPSDTQRNISLLYRFIGGGRGDYGILRTQLLDQQGAKPIPGSVSGWNTVNGTHVDMAHSVFCVCPPGMAQHTLRMWRAIVFGCIPVTFFSGNDLPYQFARLEYHKFTVNINPSEVHLLDPVMKGLLARPERVQQMQSELAKVQAKFLWDFASYGGAFQAVTDELALHPYQFVPLTSQS